MQEVDIQARDMLNEFSVHLPLQPGGGVGTLTFGGYERTKYNGHSENGTQYEMQFFTSDPATR